MNPVRLCVEGALALALLLPAATALGYCRTTTCIPGDDCEYDGATGCALSGIPLEWKSSCVSFGVQRDGSPLRSIPFDQAQSIVEGAYAKWLGSSCSGGLPSVDLANLGAISCGAPQYNKGGPNANVWMFRDEDWGGGRAGANASQTPSGTLAITIITFHPDTGEIFDADVEINSEQVPLTTGDEDVEFDLASIVTHEAGHFLGLSHSREPDAAMRAGYLPGTTSLRQLSADDQAGMCAIYPPDRTYAASSCSPRHGFSSGCYRPESGCSVSSAGLGAPGPLSNLPWRGGWPLLAACGLGLGLVWRRRAGV